MAGLMMSWLMIWSLVFLDLPKQLLSQQSPDTTLFNFTAFDGTEPDITYQGDAHIPSDTRFIRLTATAPPDGSHHRPPPLLNRVGRVLYSPPIRLWDRAGRRQATFQTIFRGFIGSPLGGFIGDGIAFFVAPVNTTIPAGSSGGSLGLYSSTGFSFVPLMAVELDVFVNRWDPDYRHVGINLDTRISRAVAWWDSGGFERDVEARITYDARQKMIYVIANSSSSHPAIEPIVARVEYKFDLKTMLPEWVQIGISASTGQGPAAYHDIRSWSFISFMGPDDVTDTPNDDDDNKDINYIRQFV